MFRRFPRRGSRAVLLVAISAALFLRVEADTPANVAVISTADTADLGALVVTELSSNPAVHLLERNDLAKIGDEAKVQQLAGSDSIALGKLVGADGLCFIDKESGTVRVRFTAVALGYNLFDDQLSEQDLAKAVKALAHRIADYAPKLRLDPSKALPLTLVNLRAETGDADSVGLERPLTLLVESRLSLVPEYVVLERRHAWSLSFEHAVTAPAKPLLQGAFLIDGTISRREGNACVVHLRVRDPHGGPEKSADLSGAIDKPALLADEILDAIAMDIPHASPALTSFDTAREADEYLHEALWGWRANAPQSALEAIDSAELLGASAYTVIPMRVNILCAVADQGMERWDPKSSHDPEPVFTTPSLASRVDTIERAIDDVARYRDEKMESNLQGFVPDNSTERFFFRTGEILPKVSWIASKLLLMLEEERSSSADELRAHMRKATSYDPLHGKNGVMIANSGFHNGNSADPFADDWAQNLEEELAWYHLVYVDKEAYPPRSLGGDPDATFCARFLTTPEARHQAWNDFVASLKSDPKSHRMGLVLATRDRDPAVADQAYREYLNYLTPQADRIGSSDDYDPLFGDYWRIPENVVSRNAAAGLPLLHSILNAPQPGHWSIDTIRMLWRSDQFSAQDAPVLWRELNEYQKRRNDLLLKKDGRPDVSFLSQVNEMATPFRQKFPEVASQPLPETAVNPPIDAGLPKLVVSSFWHPWLAPDYPSDGNPVLSSYATGGDDIYISSFRGSSLKGVIFEVHLPDFTTRVIPTMDESYVQNVLWTPGALYVALRNGNSTTRRELARYDLAAGTWTKHQLDFDFLQNEMFSVNGMLYLGSAYAMSVSDADCGLTKYDWDTSKATTLASSRRRPAQNQFDDASPYRIDDVFAGPDGKPVMSTPRGAYYIQEAPGPWPLVINGAFADATARAGNQALIYNNNGEATLIDPKLPAPTPIMASDIPTYRVSDVLKGHPPASPTPWAAQAIFDCPPGKRKDISGHIGWHDGSLFIFSQPDKTRDEYEILYYNRAHGRRPVHIPIEFRLVGPTRDEMSKHPGHLPNGWTLEELEHPHSPFTPMLLMTDRGLCLRLMETGFWFIPYGDIETYAKSAPATN